jgi:hypothetical protein
MDKTRAQRRSVFYGLKQLGDRSVRFETFARERRLRGGPVD